MTNQAVILIVMAGYMLMIIAIGILFARRSNKNAESYFLGGRTLGPWVSAMSAEASDMSGYLLMGVPGLAYWCGLADAGWTAIGLALGTYLNWLLVSRRLPASPWPLAMPLPCRISSAIVFMKKRRSFWAYRPYLS